MIPQFSKIKKNLKIKGILPSGTSFNDVALSGESNIYTIQGG